MWRPLLHFALLGTALFAVDRLWWSAPAAPPVVIDSARVLALRTEVARLLGRPPTRAELERALGSEVDDELLYRQALARGYLESDPVVFRRLVQNLRFAGADDGRDDVSLFEEALAIGLHESDVVVSRRFVQRMRLELEASADADPPDEAALRAHHARNAALYRSPARARIAQLYFTREHEERARAALERLRVGGIPPEEAESLGDPFLLAVEQPPQTRDELADRFGASFADGVFEAEPGAWTDPIPSAYGLHLVRVHERVPERAQPFEEVRETVRLAVFLERRRAALERALASLRDDVEIRIEWPELEEPDAADVPGSG